VNIGIWGWDEVDLPLISQWRKIHVNAVGDVQVDVGSSALPLGAASAANQIITNASLTDMIEGQGHCYGWDGATWRHLLVESAAQNNLRVKLYDGANGIDSILGNTSMVAATRGLATKSLVYGRYGNDTRTVYAQPGMSEDIPNSRTALFTIPYLIGYNGSKWDRLRTWGLGVLKTGRAEIDSTTIRKTAAGAVVAGAHNLYWVACSPDSPSAEWELSDDTDGSTAAVYDHFDSDKHSEHLNFDPPMKFATGIYIKKFDHMHSLVFCYK